MQDLNVAGRCYMTDVISQEDVSASVGNHPFSFLIDTL